MMATDRYDIERAILGALRDAADEAVSALAGDLPLGSSGATADLAAVAGEFVGFAIRAGDEPLEDVADALRTYARYFDRVALVVDPGHLSALRSADLGGAALWSVRDGALVEHASGTANTVGVAALLDLLSVEQRQALLRPLIPKGPVYDRSKPPITAAELRGYVEGVLAKAHGASAALLRAAWPNKRKGGPLRSRQL